jgi:hypothetical protein
MKAFLVFFGAFFWVLHSTAIAAQNSVTAFERAFRIAHDSRDVRKFKQLVWWDHATSEIQNKVLEQWRSDNRWRISRMQIQSENKIDGHDANVKPSQVLLVWYSKFESPSRYLIASRGGEYRLVIERALYRRGVPIYFAH